MTVPTLPPEGTGYLTSTIVPGVPVPQGSTRSFERNGRTWTTSANAGRLERWRGDIRTAFRPPVGPSEAMGHVTFSVGVTFLFARPPSHLNSKGEVRLPFVGKRPGGDTDKLIRAVLDALTHLVWTDDEQVAWVAGYRRWARPGETPGAHITIATED